MAKKNHLLLFKNFSFYYVISNTLFKFNYFLIFIFKFLFINQLHNNNVSLLWLINETDVNEYSENNERTPTVFTNSFSSYNFSFSHLFKFTFKIFLKDNYTYFYVFYKKHKNKLLKKSFFFLLIKNNSAANNKFFFKKTHLFFNFYNHFNTNFLLFTLSLQTSQISNFNIRNYAFWKYVRNIKKSRLLKKLIKKVNTTSENSDSCVTQIEINYWNKIKQLWDIKIVDKPVEYFLKEILSTEKIETTAVNSVENENEIEFVSFINFWNLLFIRIKFFFSQFFFLFNFFFYLIFEKKLKNFPFLIFYKSIKNFFSISHTKPALNFLANNPRLMSFKSFIVFNALFI